LSRLSHPPHFPDDPFQATQHHGQAVCDAEQNQHMSQGPLHPGQRITATPRRQAKTPHNPLKHPIHGHPPLPYYAKNIEKINYFFGIKKIIFQAKK
jgi:hypothetical protein